VQQRSQPGQSSRHHRLHLQYRAAAVRLTTALYPLRVRYLITGGAGFIGSHLSEALVERGDEVVALDNLTTGNEANLAALSNDESFRLVLGSVMDELLVDELVEQCDVIVHLASAVGVKLIVEQPSRSLRTIVAGTEKVLDAAHRYRKKMFVASTSEVYGKNSGKMHENADRVLGPTSVGRWAYSIGKSVDEVLAFAAWREHAIPTVVARFFNTVGPRQIGRYGMVVPRFVASAVLGRDLEIHGDGSQTRCFCDVSDVVRGVLALLDEPRAVGDVFNIGSEEEVSIAELAERVIAAAGSSSARRTIPYEQVYGDQYEDMLRRVPDTAKIRALTGWTPIHDLDSIIKRTLQYAEDVGPERLLS
jgi:UDP-glucose 4-epimerase